MKLFRDGLEQEIDARPIMSRTAEGHAVETYFVKGKKKFFVTLAGLPYCAHGATLAQAIADAIWKDEKQRPTLQAVKEIICKAGKLYKISVQEFRVLTGACSEGCAMALEKAGLDGSPMVIEDVVKYFPEWGHKLQSILEWD